MKVNYSFLLCHIFYFMSFGVGSVLANDGALSIQSYDHENKLLLLNVVAPQGEGQLFLQSNGLLTELDRFSKVGDFLLKVYLPCENISKGDSIYYRFGNTPPLYVSLDRIKCSSNKSSYLMPRILHQQGQCFVDHRGTTLWRVGTALSEMNGFTVYQNMYGVYLTNKRSFVKGDLSKMMSDVLRCPSTALLSTIDAQHAKAMFHEYEDFRKSSQ
ncbi:hypothetical protein OB952_21505 [Aeromonas salmonicida]|uniref:hypothetical protein n=1 Tax=Aeromonas salmonicida TaxID=645 RepID=UPI00259D935F|nr:hypothetical protein [Aeromonas salmonicida]MDM5069914.1 hypothetical protein [Aeromonas salmonicida]